MQLISCQNGRLITTLVGEAHGDQGEGRITAMGCAMRGVATGLSVLDAIAPNGRLARGAVHELLAHPAHGLPAFVALVLARAISMSAASTSPRSDSGGGRTGGAIVWCDPSGELYPPAAARMIPLEKLYLLYPRTLADQSWAVAECLRCRGVAATVAPMPARLSRVEARRLQLAAEQGGGAGLILRPLGAGNEIYAAATRWLVEPVAGERTVHKYRVQLIHGHGGRIGQAVILEHHREFAFDDRDDDDSAETDLVRAVAELADRPVAPQAPAKQQRLIATTAPSHRRAS